MRIKLSLLVVFMIMLSSCATPIGQIREEDMGWTRQTINANYQAVYRNLREGFRKCGDRVYVDGDLYTDIKEGKFDIYLTTFLGGKSSKVYGVANVKYVDENRSAIEIGVNNKFDKSVLGKKGWGRKIIFQWAEGKYVCANNKALD